MERDPTGCLLFSSYGHLIMLREKTTTTKPKLAIEPKIPGIRTSTGPFLNPYKTKLSLKAHTDELSNKEWSELGLVQVCFLMFFMDVIDLCLLHLSFVSTCLFVD